MNAPFPSCPCGRPRAAGCLTQWKKGAAQPWHVEYLHPDSTCVWTLQGTTWVRSFRMIDDVGTVTPEMVAAILEAR